jgi:mycofactocin precursor
MPETSQTEQVDAGGPGPKACGDDAGEVVQAPNVVVDDLAIEDVSIDGMCGVY